MGIHNLLTVCPDAKDATSFYRGIGPLSHLRKFSKINFRVNIATDVNWASIAMCDSCFMQRPFTDQHLQIAKMIKAQGLPIWIDYDDDLFNVPKDNPTYHVYGNPKIQKNVAELIAMANIVSVSTEHLKRRFQDEKALLNKNVVVIPNGFNKRIVHDTSKLPTQNLVLWRGSATHARDLHTYADQMVEMFYKHENFTWCFIGPKKSEMWFLADRMVSKGDKDRVVFIDAQDPIEYFKFLKIAAAKIQIVPLHDSTFNRAKSNIAWIEGSYAGSACLVPDWEEWQRPGTFRYESPEHFGVCLDEMLKMHENLGAPVAQSWDHITQWLTLDEVNKKREAILAQLSGMTR